MTRPPPLPVVSAPVLDAIGGLAPVPQGLGPVGLATVAPPPSTAETRPFRPARRPPLRGGAPTSLLLPPVDAHGPRTWGVGQAAGLRRATVTPAPAVRRADGLGPAPVAVRTRGPGPRPLRLVGGRLVLVPLVPPQVVGDIPSSTSPAGARPLLVPVTPVPPVGFSPQVGLAFPRAGRRPTRRPTARRPTRPVPAVGVRAPVVAVAAHACPRHTRKLHSLPCLLPFVIVSSSGLNTDIGPLRVTAVARPTALETPPSPSETPVVATVAEAVLVGVVGVLAGLVRVVAGVVVATGTGHPARPFLGP